MLLSELQNFLSGLQTGDLAAGGGNRSRSIDLSTAINAEAVNSIAGDADRSEALLAHLPTIESGDNAKQQLKDTIQSPQFQQALSMFSSALQSGQLGPVVSQFQLSDEAVAAANTGDLEQFVKALEKHAETNGATGGTAAVAAAAATAAAAAPAGTKKKDDEQEETPMEEDKNA